MIYDLTEGSFFFFFDSVPYSSKLRLTYRWCRRGRAAGSRQGRIDGFLSDSARVLQLVIIRDVPFWRLVRAFSGFGLHGLACVG